MYMAGLGDSQIINVDTEDQCKNAGGVIVGFVRSGSAAHDKYGRFLPGNVRCALPQSQAVQSQPSGPVNVTVSPQINTQVSPQISPVFQQQFQPSNSPATAGATQLSAPPAPPAGPVGVNSGSMQPGAPTQLPAAPAPSYPAPSYPTYSAPPPAATAMPEQLPPSPLPSQTPPISAPVVSTAAPVQAGFDWKIGAVLAAGLFGVMALSGKKGK